MKRCAFVTLGDDVPPAARVQQPATDLRIPAASVGRHQGLASPVGSVDYQPDRLSWATFSWVSLPPASRLVQCHRASLGDQLKNSLVLVQSR